MTAPSCPKCKAFWIESASTCRFCGYSEANQGTAPSQFDPDHQPAPGIPKPDLGDPGDGGGKVRRRVSGLATTVVAVIVAVGLAAAIAFVVSRTIGKEDHGNHELSAVCTGEGQSDAAAYDPTAGASGLLILDRRGSRWNSGDTRPVSEIDLVACRTQGDKPFRSLGCQARMTQLRAELRPESGGSGEIVTFSTELYRITLEFREARTGEVVATEHVAPPNSCPSGDGLLLIDVRNKRHRVVPTEAADAVLAVYEGGGAGDETAGS